MPQRLSRLEREDEDERVHDEEVEREREEVELEARLACQLPATDNEDADSPGRQRGRCDPRRNLVLLRGEVVALRDEVDDHDGHRPEAQEGEPATQPLDGFRHGSAWRSASRARAQAACSRSSGSEWSRKAAAAARCSGPPELPRATRAFRRRYRASFRGT
jgi:hypothetical protein